MDTSSIDGFYWFAQAFIKALPEGHAASPSPYQGYIANPRNAFNALINGSTSLTAVGNETFALRLAQLMNTYWMAMLAPSAIPKGLKNTNLTADIARIDGSTQKSTTAIITTAHEVLTCNHLWLAVLAVSASATAVLGLCGVVATLCRRAPDLGLNVSSLVKDSPFVGGERHVAVSSTLDAAERSRACRDIVVKYGDVRGQDEEVGYIAIGSADRVLSLAKSSARRLYE